MRDYLRKLDHPCAGAGTSLDDVQAGIDVTRVPTEGQGRGTSELPGAIADPVGAQAQAVRTEMRRRHDELFSELTAVLRLGGALGQMLRMAEHSVVDADEYLKAHAPGLRRQLLARDAPARWSVTELPPL